MPGRVVHCRIPCELDCDGRTRRGIAVNVSERGLFVQMSGTLPLDARLRVRLFESGAEGALEVEARVARVKRVHPSAQAVVARGVGLEVLDAGPAWRELTARLGCSAAEAAAGEAARASGGDPAFGLPRFRVVLRRKDDIRIRTRVVIVACLEAGDARAGVEADLEAGWEIVKVERESPALGSGRSRQPFRVVALREGGVRRWETRFEAVSAEAARAAAASDLGAGWQIERIEGVGPEGAEAVAAAADPVAPGPASEAVYQVKARLADGDRIRTRVAKLQAASPEEAAARVVAHLGAGWQAVRVTRITQDPRPGAAGPAS